MSDEEYEQASPEEKLQIANYFFMQAPVGEIDEVVKDVSTLVNDDSVLSTGKVAEILENYNLQQFEFGANPDVEGGKIIVCAAGKAEGGYVDPDTGKVYAFDHTTRTFGEQVGDSEQKNEEVRAATAEALSAYLLGNYSKGKAYSGVYGSDEGLKIIVSGQNVHLGNCWTGSWRGEYTVDVSASGTTALTGKTTVAVHYFEDGNVQLHAAIDNTVDVTVADAKATGSSIAAAIAKIELDFQNNLEEMYITMHNDTFKQMRRFLPKTKMKMNWNAAAHNMVEQLSG